MINVLMKTQIKASVADVWAIVGDFSALPKFVEAAVTSNVDGEGVGSVRTISLPDGNILKERLEKLDSDATTLKYSIVEGPLPVANYLSTMTIFSTEGGCQLEWSSQFDAQGLPEEDARNAIAGIYQMGFDGLSKIFK